MKKTLSSISLGILFLLVLTSFASALSLSSSSTLSQNGGSLVLSVANATEGANISFTSSVYSDGDIISEITFSSNDLELIGTNTSGSHTLIYSVDSNFEFDFEKDYSVTILAVDELNHSNNKTISLLFEKKFYNGNKLKISEIELTKSEGFGYKDDYFYPFDEVELSFNVDNQAGHDVEEIEIEICVWDVDAEECVFDESDFDNLDSFDLNKGDDEDITATLIIDAENLNEGSENYTIYIRAIGNIDDSDSDNDGDEVGGTDFKSKIEIRTNEDFVIINNIKFNSESVSCGDEITLTADVWNIGGDLDDDEIFVEAYSAELGIEEVVEFDSGIDALTSEEISFTFEIKNDLSKTPKITFTAYNDEKMRDKDIFEASNKNEDQAIFTVQLPLDSDSCSVTPNILVDAELQSDAKSGKDLIVKATITNSGSTAKTFFLLANNYEDFASSAVLDKNTITLKAGESAEVLVTLKILNDAGGENGFDLEIVDGSKTFSQPVSVVIEKSSSFNLSGFAISGNNAYLYGIVALNVVLVAGIVFVALRLAKKKPENLE